MAFLGGFFTKEKMAKRWRWLGPKVIKFLLAVAADKAKEKNPGKAQEIDGLRAELDEAISTTLPTGGGDNG